MLKLIALFVLLFGFSQAAEIAGVSPKTLNYGDVFGYFVAAYEDLVVVGAPGTANLAGAVYVYNCSDPTACYQTKVIYSPHQSVNDTFGASVGIYDGLVVVGAPFHNSAQGAAYVYDCDDPTDCSYQSTLPYDSGIPGDGYGYYLFVYDSWVIVGAPGYDNSTGSAYLYNCSDYANCDLAYTFQASDSDMGDWYGISVGIYDWLVVVGADHKNNGNGAIYCYNCSDPYDCSEINHFPAPLKAKGGYFGAFTYVYDDYIYAAAFLQQNGTGAVYIYDCGNGYNCTWASTITPKKDGSQFGSFVAVYEEWVVITAQYANDAQGAAYVYDCSDVYNCTYVSYLNSSNGKAGDYYGYSAAITDSYIVVSAPFHDIYKGEFYTYYPPNYNAPTSAPTPAPTYAPTLAPTYAPTNAPTHAPTPAPTAPY